MARQRRHTRKLACPPTADQDGFRRPSGSCRIGRKTASVKPRRAAAMAAAPAGVLRVDREIPPAAPAPLRPSGASRRPSSQAIFSDTSRDQRSAVLKATTPTGSEYCPSRRSRITVSRSVRSSSISRQLRPRAPKSSSTTYTSTSLGKAGAIEGKRRMTHHPNIATAPAIAKSTAAANEAASGRASCLTSISAQGIPSQPTL